MREESKKRIAFIVNTLSSGGAEHVAANLSRALSDRYDIDLILNDDKNIAYSYSGNIISLGLPSDKDRTSHKYQAVALVKRTALLHRLKAERKYAATISFSDSTNLSNVLSGDRFGRTIASVRYSLEGKEKSEKKTAWLHRLSLDISLALANSVVSCSEEIGDELKKKLFFNRRKLKVIYNGIDAKEIIKSKKVTTVVDTVAQKNKTIEIITVGRLSEQKAQWHILYALKELKKRGIRANLTILGEGPLRKDLEELSSRLGIEDQVSMPGWVQKPSSYLVKADVAVFTSTYEGFCNAILEAIACGVPCISTDHSTGAREILAPDTDWNNKVTDRIECAEYGMLIPVSGNGYKDRYRDVPDKSELLLADAIQEMLENNDLSDRYREAGLVRTSELTLEAAADQWAEEAEKLSPRTVFKIKISTKKALFFERCWGLMPDKLYICWRFYKFFGNVPDLDDPKTYNEKVQWLKLNYKQDEYTELVDKSRARYRVAEMIGKEHIIPILGEWDSADEIDFSSLPEKFVLKCTHDSGSAIFCIDRSKFDFSKARKTIQDLLKIDYYLHSREWPYKNVKPKVIAEPYLEGIDGSTPVEYKVLCFDGRAEVIAVCQGKSRTRERTNDFYDREFNLLQLRSEVPVSRDAPMKKPEYFSKILEYADCLSQGMPHVRTDFYYVDGNIYFGEMTFYPHGGFFKFDPPEWDRILGDKITLPPKTN